MHNLVWINKPVGLTPLQALDLLRQREPRLATAKLSYAGRLDPLAEGLMLVLVDNENQNRDQYLATDKTYELEIMLGASTDTGDVLGLVEQIVSDAALPKESDLIRALGDLVGTQAQRAPRFSAPGIDGKDFVKEVSIYAATLLGSDDINRHDLGNLITGRINAVSGDFRQGEVVRVWREALSSCEPKTIFPIIKCEIKCSSGTYMRLLASRFGEAFHLPALALSIKRTKVGDHSLTEAGVIDLH